MIQIPPGFDYVLFFTQLLECASPFVAIAFLMTSYRLLKRAANRY